MAFWLFITLVLAVVALRRAVRAEQALVEYRREILELRRMVQRLADRLGESWTGTDTAAPTAGAAGVPDATGVAGAIAVTDTTHAETASGAAAGRIPIPGPAPGVAYASAAAETVEPAAAPLFSQSHAPGAPGIPPLPPHAPRSADQLESDIGGRWLLYIGIAALVLGVSYFLKYAFDNEWIGEHARVMFGVVGGVALTLLGRRFVRTGHVLYGQVLCGGGIGILYLSIFAAHAWYGIIGSPLAFTAMVVTTVVAAGLADQQRSQPLALFAVAVGFATPFLISSDEGSHVRLFTYDAILVAGTLFLARRRAWPALNLVSYVLTVLTIVLWADRAYRPNLYLSVELFLTLFVVLFLMILRENRRTTTPAAQVATLLLALAPVMYHFGSLVNLRGHLGPLFVYLIAFSVAGIISAVQLQTPWIRVLVFAGVALPAMGLLERGLSRGWLAAAWTTVLAIYGAHLVAQIDALGDAREAEAVFPKPLTPPAPLSPGTSGERSESGRLNGITEGEHPLSTDAEERRSSATEAQPHTSAAGHAAGQVIAGSSAAPALRARMSGADIILLHASGLWLLFCVQALVAPRAVAWSAALTFGLAAWYGALAFLARGWHREAALHATALASALVAVGCAVQFNGPWLVVAIAAEGTVLVWLALQSERLWLRLWGFFILALAVARALALLVEPVPIGYLPIANPRTLSCLFIVGVLYVLAWLHKPGDAGDDATDATAAPSAGDAARANASRRAAFPSPASVQHMLVIAANVLTLVILSAEIDAFFDRRAWVGGVERVAGAETSAALSRQLALSVVWALYAVALIAIGMWRAYRPVRYLAMVVFAFTIVKVFLVDIATLDRFYKMLSVMALGVLLLIASYLYQRGRTAAAAEPTPPEGVA